MKAADLTSLFFKRFDSFFQNENSKIHNHIDDKDLMQNTIIEVLLNNKLEFENEEQAYSHIINRFKMNKKYNFKKTNNEVYLEELTNNKNKNE